MSDFAEKVQVPSVMLGPLSFSTGCIGSHDIMSDSPQYCSSSTSSLQTTSLVTSSLNRRKVKLRANRESIRKSWTPSENDEINQEFWESIKESYDFIMESQLMPESEEIETKGEQFNLDSVQNLVPLSPDVELSWDNTGDFSTFEYSTWSLSQFIDQYNELYEWLIQLQVKLYAGSNPSEKHFKLAIEEELRGQEYRRRLFVEQGERVAQNNPSSADEVHWRIGCLCNKWDHIQATLTPANGPNESSEVVQLDLHHEEDLLCSWLSTMEGQIQPITCRLPKGFSLHSLSEKYNDNKILLKDIEAHGPILSNVLRQYERFQGLIKAPDKRVRGVRCPRRKQKVPQRAKSLEKRWHQIYLTSLEWHYYLEGVIANFKEDTSSCDTSHYEPVAKCRRLTSPAPKSRFASQSSALSPQENSYSCGQSRFASQSSALSPQENNYCGQSRLASQSSSLSAQENSYSCGQSRLASQSSQSSQENSYSCGQSRLASQFSSLSSQKNNYSCGQFLRPVGWSEYDANTSEGGSYIEDDYLNAPYSDQLILTTKKLKRRNRNRCSRRKKKKVVKSSICKALPPVEQIINDMDTDVSTTSQVITPCPKPIVHLNEATAASVALSGQNVLVDRDCVDSSSCKRSLTEPLKIVDKPSPNSAVFDCKHLDTDSDTNDTRKLDKKTSGTTPKKNTRVCRKMDLLDEDEKIQNDLQQIIDSAILDQDWLISNITTDTESSVNDEQEHVNNNDINLHVKENINESYINSPVYNCEPLPQLSTAQTQVPTKSLTSANVVSNLTQKYLDKESINRLINGAEKLVRDPKGLHPVPESPRAFLKPLVLSEQHSTGGESKQLRVKQWLRSQRSQVVKTITTKPCLESASRADLRTTASLGFTSPSSGLDNDADAAKHDDLDGLQDSCDASCEMTTGESDVESSDFSDDNDLSFVTQKRLSADGVFSSENTPTLEGLPLLPLDHPIDKKLTSPIKKLLLQNNRRRSWAATTDDLCVTSSLSVLKSPSSAASASPSSAGVDVLSGPNGGTLQPSSDETQKRHSFCASDSLSGQDHRCCSSTLSQKSPSATSAGSLLDQPNVVCSTHLHCPGSVCGHRSEPSSGGGPHLGTSICGHPLASPSGEGPSLGTSVCENSLSSPSGEGPLGTSVCGHPLASPSGERAPLGTALCGHLLASPSGVGIPLGASSSGVRKRRTKYRRRSNQFLSRKSDSGSDEKRSSPSSKKKPLDAAPPAPLGAYFSPYHLFNVSQDESEIDSSGRLNSSRKLSLIEGGPFGGVASSSLAPQPLGFLQTHKGVSSPAPSSLSPRGSPLISPRSFTSDHDPSACHEDVSSLSEQAWDPYQDLKSLSEAYSEDMDRDAAKRLLEFGDDYRKYIDSDGSWSFVSRSGGGRPRRRSPYHYRRRLLVSTKGATATSDPVIATSGAAGALAGATNSSSCSSTDGSDLNDLRQVIDESLAQLVNVECQFDGFSSQASHGLDLSELVATASANLKCLQEVLKKWHSEAPDLRTELESVQDIVERWEALQVKAEEFNRQSTQLRQLQRQVKCLRLNMEELMSHCSSLAHPHSLNEPSQIGQKIQDIKTLLDRIEDLRSDVSSLNVVVHRFSADIGSSFDPLKNDMTELYRLWDELYRKANGELTRLESAESTWRLWEEQRTELSNALKQDYDTLKVIGAAIESGRLTDNVTSSVQDVARLLNERKRLPVNGVGKLQQEFSSSLGSLEPKMESTGAVAGGTRSEDRLSDSGTSGYESCSSDDLSERERRLAYLRRLARDLEGSLVPGSKAWNEITETLAKAERELHDLQDHCRGLLQKTAHAFDPSATSARFRFFSNCSKRRPSGRESKGNRSPRVERRSPKGTSTATNGGGSSTPRRDWLWRVVKASVPFQAVILLMICVAYLLEPNCCDYINNFNLSLRPQFRHAQGASPPI